MTQQYTHSITKEAISELPLEEFTGRIIVIDTLRDVEKAVGYLSEFQSVGFDTETRPSVTKYRLCKYRPTKPVFCSA